MGFLLSAWHSFLGLRKPLARQRFIAFGGIRIFEDLSRMLDELVPYFPALVIGRCFRFAVAGGLKYSGTLASSMPTQFSTFRRPLS